MNLLQDITAALVAPGKGILAADESTGSANKVLAAVGIAETPEMRRVYREVFLTTPQIEKHLSGVILYEETFNDHIRSGVPFIDVLNQKGILVGIKVDQGTRPFGAKELITDGLVGLPDRLKGFKEKGAHFAKWRAVITIEGDELPTSENIHEHAVSLATYAKNCQEAGIVPILEPEVLLQGDHTRARAEEVISEVLQEVFVEVAAQGVDPEALIIKSSMAVSGSDSGCKDTPQEVAEDTLDAFHTSIPEEVTGIVFLSGGQTASDATANLQAIAERKENMWQLTFSFARALQGEALAYWAGDDEKIAHAQKIFLKRLELVALARDGRYRDEMESELQELL
ncbi:MAG: fructose-bisphosphate aldolase class I [Bacteroidetes bacterium]|nr:MAG: fructose-bisphosphate aldolase class I [Bacteroidota bacterium]